MMSDNQGRQPGQQSAVDERGRDEVQAMRMSIRDGEEGYQELGKAALEKFEGISAGDNLTLYRLARRDVDAGKPARLSMRISQVNPDRHIITFSGRYESNNGVTDFTEATLTVFPDGSVVVPDPKAPQDKSLWVRRAHEDFLLFTDRPVTDTAPEGDVQAGPIGDIRKTTRERGTDV